MKFGFWSVLACTLLIVCPITTAQSVAGSVAEPVVGSAQASTPGPILSIAPAAADAVQTVNSFMTALIKGDMTAAGQYLDPGVIVVANGVIYGSREQYLSVAARGDGAFLRAAQRQLLRRWATGGGNFATVISEKVLRVARGERVAPRLNSETMLLAHTDAGWKIVHIHWSSREMPGR
jgi:ketosteroid isomerase-like protein